MCSSQLVSDKVTYRAVWGQLINYLTPKLLVVEKKIQNLNNFGRESYKRKFYLFTMWSVGRDLSSSMLFLDAEINI